MDNNNANYYENKLRLLVCNIILNISDISKILGKNLNEFTDPVGFSISAVSRIRRKVKENPETALENFPYALCMFSSLDAIYLFEHIDNQSREKIETLLLESLCEELILFYSKTGEPVVTSTLESQHWYCMDFRAGKGFVYQVQFFLNQINKMKEGDKLKALQEELLQKLQECKIAFTVMGLKKCQGQLEDIKESFKNTYQRDISQTPFYVSALIKESVYIEDISKDLLEIVTECPENENLLNQTDYFRDLADIVMHCLEDASYLLLFVGTQDDVKKSLLMMPSTYKEKIIFGYNHYFESTRQTKIVLEYKEKISVLNPNNCWSKYESLFNSDGSFFME